MDCTLEATSPYCQYTKPPDTSTALKGWQYEWLPQTRDSSRDAGLLMIWRSSTSMGPPRFCALRLVLPQNVL